MCESAISLQEEGDFVGPGYLHPRPYSDALPLPIPVPCSSNLVTLKYLP